MFAGAVNCVVATQNGGLCNSERIQESDVEDNRRFVPSGAFILWMDIPSKVLATTSVSVTWSNDDHFTHQKTLESLRYHASIVEQ